MTAILAKSIKNTVDKVDGNKWVQTLSQLLELAKKASEDYDYERSLKHLESMEELWATKGLPTFSLELRFELHNEKGKVLTKLGRNDEAVTEYQKLLEFCKEKKLVNERIEVFLEIGQLLAKTGEHDRAIGYVHRALSEYRRLNDSLGICKSLRNLGVIYIELGEFEDAETAYEEAIEIAEQGKSFILIADLNNNLGTIRNIKGDWQGALKCYTRAKDIYKDNGEVRKSAYTLNNIGITLMEKMQYEKARDCFLSALKAISSIKDESLLLILNINLADLSLKIGNFKDAQTYCSATENYLESKDLRNSQLAETKKLAGKLALAEKDYRKSMECFDEALELCDNLGLQYMKAEVLFEKGNLFLITEKHVQALQILENSIKIFHKLDAAGQVKKTEGLIHSIEELYLKVFEAMAFRVDQKDSYTKGHSDRVANISLHIAQKLDLPDHEIKAIVAGALLHDIGKLQIPDRILKKDGKLTSEEYEEIKKHPDCGLQLLSGIKLPWDVIPLIRHHHEKFDGSGYPSGLKEELIPLGARVICIADVFDALTSARLYRDAYSSKKALDVMKVEMASSFDTLVLDTFVELIQTGQLDYIINRQTDPDEMYKIWALCSFHENNPA